MGGASLGEDSSSDANTERRLMRPRNSVSSGPALKRREATDSMNLPNESLWDEAVCTSAVCQHPQCWASLRRIERGHPRILDTLHKSPREIEDKLPTLTVVNISDTCLWAKKGMAQQQPPEFTFPRERSLMLKPACRSHSRSRKTSFDKDMTSSYSARTPKLSVLNLNEATLPFSEDVGNMVVTWVPEGTEKNMRSVGKSSVSSWPGKKRKKLGEIFQWINEWPVQKDKLIPA